MRLEAEELCSPSTPLSSIFPTSQKCETGSSARYARVGGNSDLLVPHAFSREAMPKIVILGI